MNTNCYWYAYKHRQGKNNIFAKRYFNQQDIDEAKESPFVEEVRGPIKGTADDALNLFKEVNMPIDTKEIATKLLATGILDDPDDYTIKDLFCIRDNINILLDYFPNEKWLLDLRNETSQYISQKTGFNE